MRKGVEKMLNMLHDNKYYDSRKDSKYEKWLSETEHNLKELTVINQYYISCMINGQDRKLIMKEILKYESMILPSLGCMLESNYKEGDILLGCDAEKEKILSAYKESFKLGFIFETIYRDILPHYKNDCELCDLILELAKKSKSEDFYQIGLNIRDLFTIGTQPKLERQKLKYTYYSGMEMYELLWDDFVNNKTDSFLYSIWSKGITATLYNNAHLTDNFVAKCAEYFRNLQGLLKDNIKGYFLEIPQQDKFEFDYIKIYNELRANNLLISIGDKLKEKYRGSVIKAAYDFDSFDIFQYDKKVISKFKTVSNGMGFSVDSEYYHTSFTYSESGTLNISVTKFEKTSVMGEKSKSSGYYYKQEVKGDGSFSSLDLFISNERQIYYRYKKRNGQIKWYPLNMKKLVPFVKCTAFMDFFEYLSEITGNLFLKDILNDLSESKENFISPITYNDIANNHNRSEYFKNTYKNAGLLKWNYNKHNINLSYILIKATEKVSMSDYGILQNTSDEMLKYIYISESEKFRIKNCVMRFLAGYYVEKEPDNKWINGTAYDYIRMCINSHQDVILHYSVGRMREEHDHYNDRQDYSYYNCKVKSFKVPSGSRFKKLRKILPDEFEWIKTKKRLINESIDMHHCVWSYYDKIGSDRCAIYSFYDKDGIFDPKQSGEAKRYTIEFLYDKKTDSYRIHQIQTKYDRGGSVYLKTHIKELLSEKLCA